MNKKMFFTVIAAALAAAILLVVACNTTARKAVKVADETFSAVYIKYKPDLILEGAQKYTVKRGDTLSRISEYFYYDSLYFPVIMLASSQVVLDPDKIRPGMELIIPNLHANINDEKARHAMRGVIFDSAGIEDIKKRQETAERLRLHAARL
ncbi:MAG: LysM peptidoglycan-binding domain-containing protein [Treponema sp.]|nr:LysM peptidoglycan-binding domain-containing protein [Treponema sp.]